MDRTFGRIVAVAAFALAVVTGCGSSNDESETSSPERTKAVSPRSTTSIPSSDTGTPSKPTSDVVLEAADGTDVSACADTRCEVIVAAGTRLPIPKSTDLENLRVVEVTDDEVALQAELIGNASFGSCLGGTSCDVRSINGAIDIRLGGNSRAAQNGAVLTVTDITDGKAVLQIAPAG